MYQTFGLGTLGTLPSSDKATIRGESCKGQAERTGEVLLLPRFLGLEAGLTVWVGPFRP